jgi:exoribonuclease-2
VFGFDELEPPEGDIQTAWELLLNADRDDQCCDLAEVAELIYGEFTPASAWATWELVHENLYFTGTPRAVSVRSQREVAGQIAAREAKEAAILAWKEFLQRIADGTYALQDERYLREVEELAYGSRQDSRVMRDLGRAERPETAHALLLELGYWDYTVDPYPRRFGLPTTSPTLDVPDLRDESREDLTHLQAFAIDDRDNVD